MYHSTFSHGLELKTKQKNRNTAISNRNTCRIGILKNKIAIHIVSAPKYRDTIESGGRYIVPSLLFTPDIKMHFVYKGCVYAW